MTPTLEDQADLALILAGHMTASALKVPLAAWEAAAVRPGLLPYYRKVVQAALAFRQAVNLSLAPETPGPATAPGPIPPPLPQPETSP